MDEILRADFSDRSYVCYKRKYYAQDYRQAWLLCIDANGNRTVTKFENDLSYEYDKFKRIVY